MYLTLALAKWESQMVNIAWLAKAKQGINQLKPSVSQVSILMIKATLLELNQRMTSIYRYCHYWDETINGFVNFYRRFAEVGPFAYSEIIGTKVESLGSKRINRTIGNNAGLPNSPKTYGNGVTIVPGLILSTPTYRQGIKDTVIRYGGLNRTRKGSVTFYSICNRSQYSTGCTKSLPAPAYAMQPQQYIINEGAVELNVLNKLQSLKERAEAYPHKAIDRNLMHILCKPEFLMMAYDNIKSKQGYMTPGSIPETLDGVSLKWFEDISSKLKTENFEFNPARRINIPKASGGTRPLTIASPREKIIQEAMRIILDIIFEPTFKESSHGFRSQRSCHTALKSFYDSFKHTQ